MTSVRSITAAVLLSVLYPLVLPWSVPAQTSGGPIANARIGYVDLQRVLARSVAGVGAREQLEREKATMQREMDGKRQELERLREELDKKGSLMTADSRREKQEAFDRRRRDAARLADDYQKELEKKEQSLIQKVLQEAFGVIDRLGKQKGYYLVLDKREGGIVYADTSADLTEEVIRAYDQETGAKGKK